MNRDLAAAARALRNVQALLGEGTQSRKPSRRAPGRRELSLISPKLIAAADWLRAELSGGPVRVSELHARAAAAGLTKRTLERAALRLGVWRLRQRCFGLPFASWYLPQPDATDSEGGTPD